MAQRSLSERLSLAVQDAIYKVADDLTTVVDEALEAFEDAAKMVEEKVTPVFNVNVQGSGNPEDLVNAIKEEVDRQRARHAPVEPGGRDETGTPLSREQLLREVYRYVAANSSRYVDWEQQYEDSNATATGPEVWITNQLADEFARVIKEESDRIDPQGVHN